MRRLFLIAIALFLGGCLVTPTPIPPTVTPTTTACDAGDQIPYVYHPTRLTVMQLCVRLTVRVELVRSESDGDYHILGNCGNDSICQSLIKPGNIQYEKGDLVIEAICAHSTTNAAPAQACAGDTDPLTNLPSVGDCITIEGQAVFDTVHGWSEVHPLARWSSVQDCTVARVLDTSAFFDPGD